MRSTMCSFAERSFSTEPASVASASARRFSVATRASISTRISSATAASRIAARLRRYRSNVSCVKRAATSLSAKGLATHRSGPALAVFLGHRHRPSGSRFFTSPTGFSISFLTYDSKHSPHV